MHVLDFAALKELMGGSEDVAKQLLASYWPDAQRLHASIQQYVESKDIDGLKKDVHTLKGSSQMIKAERFGQACYVLELAANQEGQIEDALKNFNAEYDRLQLLILQKI
jgi:HPt (histidine-containing phosphotransfer) domain-containing protein